MTNRTWAWLTVAALVYIGSYFLCSEVYRGQWQGTQIKLRLFHYQFENVLWFPLLKVEHLLTPEEFDGHVRSGASLPPADPAYGQSR